MSYPTAIALADPLILNIVVFAICNWLIPWHCYYQSSKKNLKLVEIGVVCKKGKCLWSDNNRTHILGAESVF